jgi:hypothetical protein
MRAALALVIAAACSTGARTTQPPLSGSAAARAARGPAPRIAWQRLGDGAATFQIDELPRVARSGLLAVVAQVDGDGGRGFPNLRLEVRDKSDRVVEQFAVMDASEYEALAPDGETPAPELVRRIDVANRRLAELHAEHDFVPMRAFAAPAPAGRDAPVRGGGLVVTYTDDDRLRVRARDGATLATADGRSWLAPAGQRCPQCPPCENVARLQAFYSAEHIPTIVVRITYSGTDLCWEPGDQLHVIAW